MHCLHRQRLFFGWILLVSLLTHFFVAHHEGVSELILCVQANGQVTIETPTAHAHGDSDSDPHHESSQPEQNAHHCEHEGECSDLHLSFVHPETYLSQNTNAAQDALGLRLARLLAEGAFGIFARPEPAGVLQQTQAPVLANPHPPPKQREQILATTYLLI